MKEFLRYFLTLSFIGIFFLVILPAFIKLLWSSLLRYYKGNQYADVNTLIKAEVARELGGVVQKVISNISESIEPKIKSDVKSEVARELENNFQNLIDRVYESLEPKIKDTAKKQFEQILIKRSTIPNLRFPDHWELKTYPSELDNTALNNWFERLKGTKTGRGHLYERYIGYLLETQNYKVEYPGLLSSQNQGDGGIDIICHDKLDEEYTWLIQCKNYKRSTQVSVSEIREFYAAARLYARAHHRKIVNGAFFTTSSFTASSREDAKQLNIECHTTDMQDRFPVIKCKDYFYYLPTNPDYDNVVDGYIYCLTVREAEEKGFRSAVRQIELYHQST